MHILPPGFACLRAEIAAPPVPSTTSFRIGAGMARAPKPARSGRRRSVNMAQHGMSQSHTPEPALATRLDAHFEAIHRRLDALDRRLEQRLGEIRVKQEEDLMLLKAMSCQLRGRVERVERRAARGG
jgi:hypothetical protein